MTRGLIRKEQYRTTVQMYAGGGWSYPGSVYASGNFNNTAKTTSEWINPVTEFGLPAGTREVAVRLSVRDETPGVYFSLSPGTAALGCVIARTQVNGIWNDASGVCPLSAEGSLYCAYSGELDGVYLYVWGFRVP